MKRHIECHIDSLDDAIARTSHDFPGGGKVLADRMSINPGTLYNKCNPGMPTHRLTLPEAVDVMRHCQDVRILKVLCQKAHHACVSWLQFQQVGDMALFDAWTAADMEHGKTVESIRDALSDGRIDHHEYRRIKTEMFVDFAREIELLERLNAFCNNPPRQTPIHITDLKLAMHETVQQYPGGLPDLARKLGMRDFDLHKKTSPEFPGEFLNIHDVLKLMLETGDYTVLHAMANLLDYTCVPIPQYRGSNDMELLDAWSSWSDERGDTVAAIHQALNDGVIDRQEVSAIEKGVFEDFETELALLARLELMIQEDSREA
jgi:hypothetical protein